MSVQSGKVFETPIKGQAQVTGFFYPSSVYHADFREKLPEHTHDLPFVFVDFEGRVWYPPNAYGDLPPECCDKLLRRNSSFNSDGALSTLFLKRVKITKGEHVTDFTWVNVRINIDKDRGDTLTVTKFLAVPELHLKRDNNENVYYLRLTVLKIRPEKEPLPELIRIARKAFYGDLAELQPKYVQTKYVQWGRDWAKQLETAAVQQKLLWVRGWKSGQIWSFYNGPFEEVTFDSTRTRLLPFFPVEKWAPYLDIIEPPLITLAAKLGFKREHMEDPDKRHQFLLQSARYLTKSESKSDHTLQKQKVLRSVQAWEAYVAAKRAQLEPPNQKVHGKAQLMKILKENLELLDLIQLLEKRQSVWLKTTKWELKYTPPLSAPILVVPLKSTRDKLRERTPLKVQFIRYGEVVWRIPGVVKKTSLPGKTVYIHIQLNGKDASQLVNSYANDPTLTKMCTVVAQELSFAEANPDTIGYAIASRLLDKDHKAATLITRHLVASRHTSERELLQYKRLDENKPRFLKYMPKLKAPQMLPFEAMYEGYYIISITGAAGAGKGTCLNHMIYGFLMQEMSAVSTTHPNQAPRVLVTSTDNRSVELAHQRFMSIYEEMQTMYIRQQSLHKIKFATPKFIVRAALVLALSRDEQLNAPFSIDALVPVNQHAADMQIEGAQQQDDTKQWHGIQMEADVYGATVVFCTVATALHRAVYSGFSAIFIDESSKLPSQALWALSTLFENTNHNPFRTLLVTVGDRCQLARVPPRTKRVETAAIRLDTYDALACATDAGVSFKLMEIMRFGNNLLKLPSSLFYDDALYSWHWDKGSLLWRHHQGNVPTGKIPYSHPDEPTLVEEMIQSVTRSTKWQKTEVVVLSYYADSARILSDHLDRLGWDVKVCTLDSFQGHQMPVCIILPGIYTKIPVGRYPHQCAKPRLCVALTRAQSVLIIIGDIYKAATLPCWKEVTEYFLANQLVRFHKV